jgi:hypothetical protein
MQLRTASCTEIAKMSTVTHYEEINRNNYSLNSYVIIRASFAFANVILDYA